MTKKERNLMCEGEPQPDIVKEGKAAMTCLLAFVCAIIVVALVAGLCWLVKQAILSLC